MWQVRGLDVIGKKDGIMFRRKSKESRVQVLIATDKETVT